MQPSLKLRRTMADLSALALAAAEALTRGYTQAKAKKLNLETLKAALLRQGFEGHTSLLFMKIFLTGHAIRSKNQRS